MSFGWIVRKWLFCLCRIAWKNITEIGRGGACVSARVAPQGCIHRSSSHSLASCYAKKAVHECGAQLFLWNGLPQRGSLQEDFELFFDGGFVGCTDEFVDEFAVFKEKDGGDVAHAKVGGYLVVFFDVAFAYH